MYPVHDVDAILLLAMSLAAKRRPAELGEIIAAIDLTQGVIPANAKLSQSFYRLSVYGLILEHEGGYALTPKAQQILSGHAKKAKAPERLYDIREGLADYEGEGEQTILLTEEQLAAAMQVHATNSTGKNLLKQTEEKKPYVPFRARKRNY
jgi:hypothetical protein